MKSKRLSYLITATAVLVSFLTTSSLPASSSQTKEALSKSLRNGYYFYSQSPNPNSSDYAVVFRKQGQNVVGYGYAWQADGAQCFKGKIKRNIIAVQKSISTNESGETNVSISDINLRNFLRLNFNRAHAGRKEITMCVQMLNR